MGNENLSAAQKAEYDNLMFTSEWTVNLLNLVEKNEYPGIDELINSCAGHHFRHNNMSEITAKYQGRIEDFLDYISSAWGWLVSYDKENGTITIDENKDFCVCPIVQSSRQKVSPVLCRCSEGFAQKMFSEVAQREVKATVIKSVLAGDKSCMYLIKF